MSVADSGLNTQVEYDGRRYHVQTQFSTRDAPVIESLVFHRGEALVRMTASFDDVARRLGFNGDDGRHLLELQHAELIRKVRHGMLRDDEAPDEDEPRLIDTDGRTVDPADVDDPAVLELLRDLGAIVERARPEPPAPTPAPALARPGRRRWVLRIRLPF